MNEIRIEKSLRRKIAEIFLFLWGIIGLSLSVLVAHEAFRFDFQSHVTESFLLWMIEYTLIWMGGLIFFGFFTLFAPIGRIKPTCGIIVGSRIRREMRFVEVVFSAIRADDKAEALAGIERLPWHPLA